MDENNLRPPCRVTSVPNLIAWLSVCFLAAAWGHTLDQRWQTIWAQAGLFGLVASVGLASLERARLANERHLRERTIRVRLEGGLARLQEHSATLESINRAVHRLATHAVSRHQGEPAKPGRVKRWQSLLLRQYPFELTPVEENGDTPVPAQPIEGWLRQISSRSVSFEHNRSFGSRLVLLTFKLGVEEQLSFVVDVMWTQRSNEGFASSGTVLAVGIPEQQVTV